LVGLKIILNFAINELTQIQTTKIIIMEELKKNKQIVFLALAALAFIFIAFLPTVDILGKKAINGFKVVFDGEGMGFSRFLMFLSIIAPLAAGFFAFTKKSVEGDKLVLYSFAGSFVLGFITMLALPEGCSFTTGGWLYLVVCIAGAAAAYIVSQPAKK